MSLVICFFNGFLGLIRVCVRFRIWLRSLVESDRFENVLFMWLVVIKIVGFGKVYCEVSFNFLFGKILEDGLRVKKFFCDVKLRRFFWFEGCQ